ncbi:PASTA domain-containing protein [Actinomadura kijaniata]|uniref:PASTA domain-containing protein n=1 Tax=Actinomadura kijaniata TaxID=46161 RepID=UPI003F1B2417
MPENDPNRHPAPPAEEDRAARPSDERAADERAADERPSNERPSNERAAQGPELSRRAMLLLGGGASVGAALVLGASLLVGGPGGAGHGGAGPSERIRPVGGGPVAPGAPTTVPQLAGTGSMAAVGLLAARRFPLGGIIQVPSSQRPGLVLRSHPPAGASVPGGAPVTLYVSAGRVGGDRVTVPYLVGLDEARARASAAALGLTVRTSGAGATVRAQQPAPGSSGPNGATLVLTLG